MSNVKVLAVFLMAVFSFHWARATAPPAPGISQVSVREAVAGIDFAQGPPTKLRSFLVLNNGTEIPIFGDIPTVEGRKDGDGMSSECEDLVALNFFKVLVTSNGQHRAPLRMSQINGELHLAVASGPKGDQEVKFINLSTASFAAAEAGVHFPTSVPGLGITDGDLVIIDGEDNNAYKIE